MVDEAAPPAWLWRTVALVLALVLTAGAALSLVIGMGWNNPRLSPDPDLLLPAPLTLTVTSPDERAVHFLNDPVGPFTLEALASSQDETGRGDYGLLFRASAPDRFSLFAVGTDGYVAVLRVEGRTETPLLEWELFPHVHRGRESNRIRVSCADGVCHFWVNDEFVAALPDEADPHGDLGLWSGSLGEGTTRATFSYVAVWAGP